MKYTFEFKLECVERCERSRNASITTMTKGLKTNKMDASG